MKHKMFRRGLAVAGMAVATSLCMAEPSVTVLAFNQDAASRRVTVEYRLEGGPAVVTVEILTNGVPVQAGSFVCPTTRDLSVPVNRLVQNGDYRLYWQPTVQWPGHALAAGQVSVRLSAWTDDNPPPYMGIDLTAKSNIVYYAGRESVEGGEQARRWKTDWMLFRRVPAKGAEWYYGSSGPATHNQQAGTKHYVKFTEDYYAGVYEVTQAQWSNVYVNAKISGIATSAKPSILKTGDDLPLRPVENISVAAVRGLVDDEIDWPTTGHKVRDAPKSFLGCLRKYCGVDVDLPTEAQWEYACRAGTGTKYCCGDTMDNRYAWTTANCTEPQPVGTTLPNAWGLYDFHGNVYEPCLDWMDTVNYDYPEDDNTDPQGPATGSSRCLRGGTWNGGAGLTASYLRGWVLPGTGQKNQGLRLFCPAIVK